VTGAGLLFPPRIGPDYDRPEKVRWREHRRCDMADFDKGFKMGHNSGREMCWLRAIRPDSWEPISDT
jgi:hypothetical protein